MAEWGRGAASVSKLSKYTSFLLFAPKEKTRLCIILSRNTGGITILSGLIRLIPQSEVLYWGKNTRKKVFSA